MTGQPSTNHAVADMLREAAALLEQQGANPFRTAAYRRAAGSLDALDRDVGDLLAGDGPEALLEIPDIGTGIAGAVREIVRTGRWSLLERLRGTVDPAQLFATIPGIGPELAERIHDELDVDGLEALEVAAHDGRLEMVRGIGPRRAEAVRLALDVRLGRRIRRPRPPAGPEPDVQTILDVDREYREQAAGGRLRRIAPRRFNPDGTAWLPILHTRRDEWHFTALFSNTALAHGLGRTHDWVVIYWYDAGHAEGQCTVVTETRGPLAGERVVRGREAECMRHEGTAAR